MEEEQKFGHKLGHMGERFFQIFPIQSLKSRETENLCIGGSIPSLVISSSYHVIVLSKNRVDKMTQNDSV